MAELLRHRLEIRLGGSSQRSKKSNRSATAAQSNSQSKENVAVLTEDCYYRRQCHLDMQQRALTNYDHPDSLEHDLLASHLRELRSGRSVEVPQYDYVQHTRRSETTLVHPPALLLVEGILILSQEGLRDQLDLKIFVDVPLDVCLNRRIERDTRERGRTRESIIEQFEKSVRPMFTEFTEPTRALADLVLPYREDSSAVVNDWVELLMSKLSS